MTFLKKDSRMVPVIKGEIEVSLFQTDLLENTSTVTHTIKKIVNRIRSYRWINISKKQIELSNLESLPTLHKAKGSSKHYAFLSFGYNTAVTFSGTYRPSRKSEHLQKHSGLICISFKNLSPERAKELWAKLSEDQYTHILFITSYDAGLKVVVKYDYAKPEDHYNCFCHLLDYYADKYNVTEKEHDPDAKDINYLCYLPYDPTIYYRPSSKRISLPLSTEQESNTTCINADKTTCTESVSGNTYKAFHDERVISNVLESIVRIEKWCETDFGSDSEIIIHCKPDKINADSRFISFSEIRGGKNLELVNFEFDTETKAIVSCGKKASKSSAKGNASDHTNQQVCNILVDLLASGELEHRHVREWIEKQLTCSEKKIRNSLRDVFADPAIIHTATGKLVKLVKRHHDNKNFLALEKID